MSIPRFAVRRPVTTFLLLMYPLAWALAFAAFALHLPTEPSIAVANFVGVLGPAVLVSYWIGRGAAVRRLLAGVLRWRVNIGWYLFAVLAMPLATIAVSLVTGTLPHTAGGWAGMCVTYVVALLVGAVFTNLWEEVAWAGFVQSRLTARRGLILGSVITGPLFAAQHLPLVVANGGGLVTMLVLGGALAVLSIFFRYVLGATLIGTGSSLLVVGILHASSDASGAAFGSGWQQMISGVAVAVVVLAYRAVRYRSAATPSTVEPTPATV